jgi:hypothetical protein
MSIISLIQILYFVVKQKFKSFLFFIIIGVLLKLFIKSTSYVLVIDIIVTNLLMQAMTSYEGFREGMKGATGATGTTGTTNKKQKSTSNNSPASTASTSSTSSTAVAPANSTPGEGFQGGMDLDGIHSALDRIEPLLSKIESMGTFFGKKK